MNAINQIALVPFLMSFLASRDKLPLSTVTAAGQHLVYEPSMLMLTSVMQHNACTCSLTRTRRRSRKSVRMHLTLPAYFPLFSRGRGFRKLMGRTRRLKTTAVLHCRYFAAVGQILSCWPYYELTWRRAGILRNISPIPPPSVAATVDVDRDIVLPTLEPILFMISLPEAAQLAQEQIAKEVSRCYQLHKHATSTLTCALRPGLYTSTGEALSEAHAEERPQDALGARARAPRAQATNGAASARDPHRSLRDAARPRS